MKIAGKVCVVTGAAGGIGKALCQRFRSEGAAAIVAADRDAEVCAAVAAEVAGTAVTTDVSREADVARLVAQTLADHGRIDLFVSNAGVAEAGGPEASDQAWQRSWDVNVMSHVWAARHALPSMLARGEGALLSTASAAGLLTSLGAAPYAATKHAAVAFAEWLAITYGDRGIYVACLCPQGVRTEMLALAMREGLPGRAILAAGKVLTPDDVAEATVRGLEEDRFLILPHPEVTAYARARAGDHAGWLTAMRGLLRRETTQG